MTWPTFRTEAPFQELYVSDGDIKVATLAFGWTLGFAYFVSWHAVKQSRRWGPFIIMCWLEIIVSVVLAVMCWLYLCGIIKHSFWFYFMCVTVWALQVQLLLQIIVNRICILLPTPRRRFWLRFIVAIWITTINVSVYCIWLPAKLQISRQFHDINIWWDRTEKCLYLLTDGILNYMFIRAIKDRLLAVGLKKYDKLVKFNEKIIVVSLSMDVLIITMMSYRNDLVYLQFHPVAYLVKLEIEMCMSKLMIKVATGTGIHVYECESPKASNARPKSVSDQDYWRTSHYARSAPTVNVRVATQTVTHTDTSPVGDGDIELAERKSCRRSSNEWGQSVPLAIVNTQVVLDAKSGDIYSVVSDKRTSSWLDIRNKKHISSSSVVTKNTDLECGLQEHEPKDSLTVV